MTASAEREKYFHKPVVTDLPALSLAGLPADLKRFCHMPMDYRLNYRQHNYGVAFDGYSYPGQQDSLNQGPEDELHSFVFSDFSPANHYPAEFQAFLSEQWHELCRKIKALEQAILQTLELDNIAALPRSCFGHMMSANYYPQSATPRCSLPDLRLSPHPDVSLLTVFIQGLGDGFQYQDAAGDWHNAPVAQRVTVFAGELLEWLSDGEIPALRHRVRWQDAQAERFSFALFSLPQPGAILTSTGGSNISTEEWYRLHLSQWDAVGYSHQDTSSP